MSGSGGQPGVGGARPCVEHRADDIGEAQRFAVPPGRRQCVGLAVQSVGEGRSRLLVGVRDFGQQATVRSPELDLLADGAADSEAALVHQPVVQPAEQHKVARK